MDKKWSLEFCNLKQRSEEKKPAKQFKSEPYSQCAREGNRAFPVFEGLTGIPIKKNKDS